MEQVGTAFVQVVPSLRGFHQSIGRDLRKSMGQVGEQSGQSFTRRMLGTVNRGMSKGMSQLGGLISRTTQNIARAAMAIRPVDLAVRGLQAGIRGTRLAVTGMGGALTSMGQKAQTAVTLALDGAKNLVAGFVDSDAAASAFTGTLGRIGGLARRAVQPVITGAQNLAAGFTDSQAAASRFTGVLGSIGGLARKAVQPVADGARNLAAGFVDSDAAASAFTGRLGTIGGATRTVLDPLITGTQNLVSGLMDADAAASAFTGVMGTIGGAPREAVLAIVDGVRGLPATIESAAGRVSSWFSELGDTARTAFQVGQDHARLLGAGVRGVGVSASESGTTMYRLGTTMQGALGGAARGFDRATGVVKNLTQGVRGTFTEASGLGGVFNNIGLAASTAFEVGRDGARLLSAGFQDVSVSASESSSFAYQLGSAVREASPAGIKAMNELADSAAGVGTEASKASQLVAQLGEVASTAAGVAQDGMARFSQGFHRVGVSASTANSTMYRLGTTARTVGETATSAFRGFGRALVDNINGFIPGLVGGLTDTHVGVRGLGNALNTTGMAASTAFQVGRDQVRLFSQGLKGAGVSASESSTRMYQFGTSIGNVTRPAIAGIRTMGKSITDAGGRVRQWAQQTTSSVGGLGSAFSRMGALGAAAIAGLGLGALASQMSQVAMGAATTEAQLVALYGAAGGGAAEVTAVMDGMNERFRGLDMTSMRSGAVSLAYMGLQGEEAVGVLERLEKATTATGSGAVGMERAMAALTKGVNAGKFQMGELNQISDAGIPIYDALADVLGVDIPQAQEMASAGAIGLEEVLQALSGDHGVWFPALLEGADNISQTFSGAWSTIKNTIVNGFATELVPLFDGAAPLMARFAGLVEAGFEKLPGLLDRVKQLLVDYGIVDAVQRFVDGVKEFASAATPAVREFASAFGGPLSVAIGAVLLALGPLGDAFGAVAEWMRENEDLVGLLGAALGGAAAAITLVAVAKGIWAAVTWGLAAAINATGIPLLIFAIGALIAGVIYAYNNFEGFKNVVDNVASAVKTAALWIWDNGLKPAFDGIVAGAKIVGEWCVWLWEKAIKPAWESIVDAALWLWGHLENVWGWITDAWQTLSDLFTDIPSFDEIGAALKTVASDVTTWLGEKASEIGEWFKGLPDMLWEGLVSAGESLYDWYTETFDPERLHEIGKDLADQLITGLGDLAGEAKTKLGEAKAAIIEWAEELPGTVRENIDEMVDAATEWAEELPGRLKEKFNETVDTVQEWAEQLPGQISEWFDSGEASEWVDDLKETVKERVGEITDAVVEWAKGLPAQIQQLIDDGAKIKEWITEWGPKIVAGLAAVIVVVALAIPVLLATLASAVIFVLGVIIWELGKWLWGKATELMEDVRDAILAKVDEAVEGFRQLRDDAVEQLLKLRDDAVAYLENLRDRAMIRIANMRDRVVGFLEGMRDRALNAVTNLRDRATTLFTNTHDWLIERATRMRDRVVSPMEDLRDKVINAFDRARAGIKTAWEKVEEITRKPVAFVVNTVYNDGIRGVWNKVADLVDMDTLPRIEGFATGGVLPGYTPGRDVHTFISPTGGGLELSGGEAIMRPEWTRAVGAGFVHSMNAAARTGGTAGVKAAMGFARGGIIPTQRFNEGGIWDKITSFGSKLKDIFDGGALSAAAKVVLDPIMETMAGRFTEGRWSEALIGVPSAIIRRLMEWFETVIGDMLGGDGKKVAEIAESYLGVSGNPNQFTKAFGMGGQPWCAMFVSEVIKEAKAQDAYNNVRSAAVATFANSSMGSVPSVAATRPGDLALYKGRGPGNWGHINIIANEVGGTIGGNESNAVRFNSSYSSRAAKFLRPKFAAGGIWQQNRAETSDALTHPLTRLLRAGEDTGLYDSGGWLQPGWTAVHNATGRPEAVLTPSQSDALVRIARQRDGHSGNTFNIHETRNPRATARATINSLRDYEALHPQPR